MQEPKGWWVGERTERGIGILTPEIKNKRKALDVYWDLCRKKKEAFLLYNYYGSYSILKHHKPGFKGFLQVYRAYLSILFLVTIPFILICASAGVH